MIQENIRGYGSPSRYVQGKGLLSHINEYTERYGKKPFFIIDTFLFNEYSKKLPVVYSGNCVACEEFEGDITAAKISGYTERARAFGADVVIGMGGGRSIDLGKCVADGLSASMLVIPTTASNDAPCSAMAIIYDDEGRYLPAIHLNKNPDLVIVDSEIIAKAPIRFLIAGIGDALATYFEGRMMIRENKANYIGAGYKAGYRRTLAGEAIARSSYDILMKQSVKALDAVKCGTITEALEDVIEANILLSGVGFENVACAGAHAMMTATYDVKSKMDALHGERVAFGLLVQLMLEDSPAEETDMIYDFYSKVGLPMTLKQIGIENDDETIRIIAKRAAALPEFADSLMVATPEILFDAIKYTDYIGGKYMQS